MPKAIDIHVHAPYEHGGSAPAAGSKLAQIAEAAASYFRSGAMPKSVEEMAAYYAERDIFAVLLAENWESTTGIAPVTNDFIAGVVRRYAAQFIGFCSVDPWQARKAVDEVRRSSEELGLRGVKFHPALQEFFPSDPRFRPLFEECARLKMPVLVHTGMTGFGAGMPGGAGIRSKYCAPIPYIDDLAADIPELTIIMAHPAFPWVDEQLAVLLHKGNVFMDISGWSPKYFQPQLIQHANTLLQDKVMFGSDYPMILPDRWLADFAAAPFRDEVREKILWKNANRVLGLGLGA
ncbi:MAG: amidohydrolase [Deltaproteobacteria bacterium]|nr:amidohydrolase [Deltaproteobacteria bacterium]